MSQCVPPWLLHCSAEESMKLFLNQVRAGLHTPGFLKLIWCGCLYACMFVSASRLLITSGVMWRNIDSI